MPSPGGSRQIYAIRIDATPPERPGHGVFDVGHGKFGPTGHWVVVRATKVRLEERPLALDAAHSKGHVVRLLPATAPGVQGKEERNRSLLGSLRLIK